MNLKDKQAFGLRNIIDPEDPKFEIMLESVLKRCGKYLTHLSGSNYLNEESLSLIKEECPILQSIDIDGLNLTEDIVHKVKPLSQKFKICKNFKIFRKTNDQNIENLFMDNKNLERLEIHPNKRCKLNGSFLEVLPSESIRALTMHNVHTIPIDIILQVSILII